VQNGVESGIDVAGDAGADCELIVVATEPSSLDTRLSQPDLTGRLVGMSLLKLYSNEVIGLSPGPLRRGGTIAMTHWRGRGWKPEYKTRIQSTPLLISD
jgi:hypothetical protein